MVKLLGEVTETKPSQAPAPVCDICGCHDDKCNVDQQDTDDQPTTIKCPQCGTPITELDVDMIVARECKYGKLGINDIDDDTLLAVYKCPECGYVVCDNEDEANSFVTNT
jgi:hypothetical protein